MTLEQVGLQLGIAGLLLVVVYRIAILFINRWFAAEDKKTAALTQSLTQIVASINTHSVADLESHALLTESVARLDGKLDAWLGRQGIGQDRFEVSTGVPRGEFDNDRSTPVESPYAARTKVVKPRGLYSLRGKTNGEDK